MKMMNVELYLTPTPFGRAKVENKTVVVIDVLRSSTSICAALNSGAKGVIPTDGPGEAGDMWTKIGSDNAVLAGERNGIKIENFQLGNSPAEFTPQTVKDKFVILTTTNGTAIFAKTSNASHVLSGALVNISTVAEKVAGSGSELVIACSGREGHFSIEDTICGGMLIHLLREKYSFEISLNDAGSLALLLYQTNKTRLLETIVQGEHGRYLNSIGFGRDVTMAATVDSIPILPILKDGRLVSDLEN